uniref:Uncharacterized protein n=1 Tax=Caenorhabditis japonica TaxID=281687 RepID=A0A8R1IFC2_CAEJA
MSRFERYTTSRPRTCSGPLFFISSIPASCSDDPDDTGISSLWGGDSSESSESSGGSPELASSSSSEQISESEEGEIVIVEGSGSGDAPVEITIAEVLPVSEDNQKKR